MRMNNGAQLSRFAMDANLPLLRPDSVVREMTAGLWGLYTPSCWPAKTTEFGYVIATGTREQLIAELESVGIVNCLGGKTYEIRHITFEREWWQHRAEDGMIPMEILEGK